MIENGTTWRGIIKEPILYKFSFAGDEKHFIFVEPGEITVNVSKDNVWDVKGSLSHTQWEIHNSKVIDPIRMKLIDLYAKKEESLKQGDSTTYNLLVYQNDSVSQKYFEARTNQISKKPYTFFNLFLLEQEWSSMGIAYTNNMLNEFRSHFKQYPRFQSIEREVRKRANRNIVVGSRVSNFSLPDSSGKSYQLYELLNEITIIDFWASWCGPCIKEIPVMKNIYQNYRDKGLSVISVSLDQSEKQWIKALERYSPAGINLIDKNNKSTESLKASYEIYSIPYVYIVDKNGVVVGDNLRGEDLVKKINQLINR